MEGSQQTPRARWPETLLAVIVVGVGLLAAVPEMAQSARKEQAQTVDARAEIRTTAYGVPHVLASDFAGAGFGLGYAFANSNICEIAERWITVNAQRSRYFGPDGPAEGARNATNLQSDFHWARIHDMDVVGRELRQAPPVGPTPEVRDLMRGYAAGYNKYLAEVGVNNIPDARCRGKAWVRPITDRDVFLRALHWNIYQSSGTLVQAFFNATPPASNAPMRTSAALSEPHADGDVEARFAGLAPEIDGPGSNMIALGRDATDNSKGMLFANPHWNWQGPERWWEFQMTVPGKVNVYGSGILGVPIVMFGHNQNVAWSHTLSTPRRYTVYELRLAPGAPTSYLYDGQARKMTTRTVSVDVEEADGRMARRSHTFYETHYGPVLQNTTYAWTPETAFTIRDVAMSFRWLNQQLAMNQANSIEELDAAGRKYLGIGWLNTIAADASGQTLYADRTAIPNVTNAMLERCATGKKVVAGRIPSLDGWRSECEWVNDAGTPVSGIFGVSSLPKLARTDYVTNSNDSYWTNNLHQLLEGFPIIIGNEQSPRTLRTRNGLFKIERRLAGTDGYPGKRFTLDQLETITMNNRVLSAELWRDSVVSLCKTMPAQKGLPEACDVLARWDLAENPDSRGAVLWRRFYDNLFVQPAGGGFGGNAALAAELYTVPFDPKDPMNTPSGLNAKHPKVAPALTAAINDLLGSGVALNARYGDYHFDERNGVKIAIPGGSGGPGQYNMIQSRGGWAPGKGWGEITSGSSFIMWTQFTDKGPVGRSVSSYSQSNNPESANYADQTRLFSEKKTKPILFDEAAILADSNLKVAKICSAQGPCN